MLMALDLGADDIQEDEDVLEIYTSPDLFQTVKEGMEEKGISFSSGEITMLPDTSVEVTDPDQAKLVMRMMETLDDHDDVQNTYTNFDVSDEIAEKLG